MAPIAAPMMAPAAIATTASSWRNVPGAARRRCHRNTRKPIARLHFDGKVKYLVLFDADKNRTRADLENLEDIYESAEALRSVVSSYVGA